MSYVSSVVTAVPDYEMTQEEVVDMGAEVLRGKVPFLDQALGLFRNAGVDSRYLVRSPSELIENKGLKWRNDVYIEETKKLLYDMSEKHMWADQIRHIAPFAEAWYEVFSTWGRLIKENPRVLNRMRQGVEGARESNPFAGVNADGEQDHGLFYRNPETGEEMFAYPGSGLISSAMLGDAAGNVQFEGRAGALSMASQIMPGLGPMVQIPVSAS